MRGFLLVSCSLMILLCTTGVVSAVPISYHDEFVHTQLVDTFGTTPVYWVQLYFPQSQTRGTYANGLFEYDNYVNAVDSLKITLYGHGDNSNSTIDFYLDFDGNHQAYSSKIAAHDVGSSPFTLALDVKNNDLLYNGTDVGNLAGVNLLSFWNVDTFYVGYACHFYQDKTTVDVAVNPVPEPATMLLLGSGLLSLVGLRRKFRKQ